MKNINYWLVKSEPDCYSIDNMEKDTATYWDGVRNYQARNYMRDEMKIGDKVLFYHSNAEITGVVGLCEVMKEAYPDFTALDPNEDHYDPKSTEENPIWMMVDLKFVKKFKRIVTLKQIKENDILQNMKLVQKGNRLSVMPVEKFEYDEIIRQSK